LLCGAAFTDTGGVRFNETLFRDSCGAPILNAIQQQQQLDTTTSMIKVQLWITGALPVDAMAHNHNHNLHALGSDIRKIYDIIKRDYGFELDGISLDDESHCAPAANATAFGEWVKLQSRLAMALKTHIHPNFHVTSAVQALFGIQNKGRDKESCAQLPSSYPVDRTVTDILSNTNNDNNDNDNNNRDDTDETAQEVVLQKWLVMDTYYFSTARFLSALDWYSAYIPHGQLAIGLQNRTHFSEDELVTRFHALDKANVDWINIFMLPIDDKFLEYLKRWKTHCRGCGQQRLLGCYDMSIISCNSDTNFEDDDNYDDDNYDDDNYDDDDDDDDDDHDRDKVWENYY
jgi:hypothetical protein